MIMYYTTQALALIQHQTGTVSNSWQQQQLINGLCAKGLRPVCYKMFIQHEIVGGKMA